MQRLPFRFVAFMSAALLAAGVSIPARAQDPDDAKRGVARISLIDGEVSVRRGDAGEWVAGVINAPLLTDDRISTGPNSRAEIQFDSTNLVRIGGNAEVKLSQLEYDHYQIGVSRGTVTYRVLRASNANVEVDTPSVSVKPTRIGVYRIGVNDAGETNVTARAGEVEVFTPKGSQWVNAGQTLMARGTDADPEFQIVAATGVDEWDRWNESRDRIFIQSPSAQYLPPGVDGGEALDNYGTWSEIPEYGRVWRPTVSVGWSPYSSGRWVWEDWYGWTWVSYDPWGWAPYHYGRWFYQANFGWGWYPGAFGGRHYWSPALVAFCGFGGGGGFGFGFGNVGWVPLAPFETFHPWWGRGGGFNRNINITNVNITNVYRNARVPNGVSSVRTADFQSGRFNSVGHATGEQLHSAGMVHGAMPITPSRANMHFSDRQPAFVPRNTSANTRMFTQQQASPAQRSPGSQQQGRAINQGGSTPAMRSGQNGAAGGGSWNQFGGPARQTEPAQNRVNQNLQNTRPSGAQSQRNGGGWHSFGDPASNAPRQAAPPPRSDYRGNSSSGGSSAPQFNQPSGRFNRPSGRSESMRISPPVVHERQNAPSYNAPQERYSAPAPSYNAPQQRYSSPAPQPRYSAPAPSYSAPQQRYNAPAPQPRYSAPAPSYSAPRNSGGGGGGHQSGGGGRTNGGHR